MFFYLSDTGADSGAHELMRGTHNIKKLRHLFGGVRQTDEEIYGTYGKSRSLLIEGEAGTGFIEDTSCFHRALPPKRTSRLTDFLANLPPRYSNAVRQTQSWWGAAQQRANIQAAIKPVSTLTPEYLFIHSPPVPLAPGIVKSLHEEATRWGFQLGVCSPRAEHLGQWLGQADHFKCFQLHLDDVLLLQPPNLLDLLRHPVWIHGIYSPGAGARYASFVDRENFCVDLGGRCRTVDFVIGVKSAPGVARLTALARRLHAAGAG